MSLETTTKALVDVQVYLDELLMTAGRDELGDGLQVGGRPTVGKVALAVNCSFRVIEEAALRGCDLLVTHHGPGSITDADLVDKKHNLLRQLGLNLYVAGECLNLARGFGTADALARGVGVTVQSPFKPDGESESGVYGTTGGTLDEFVTRVGTRLGFQPRVWRNAELFGRVAIVPGWGGRPEWLARAKDLGCDTILTGEALLFGLLYARESDLNLVVAGHYATKMPGVMALSARISRDLHVDVTFIPEDLLEAR
jgi:putative NIF3 family GTP cyclohydrolase 1 type 2